MTVAQNVMNILFILLRLDRDFCSRGNESVLYYDNWSFSSSSFMETHLWSTDMLRYERWIISNTEILPDINALFFQFSGQRAIEKLVEIRRMFNSD